MRKIYHSCFKILFLAFLIFTNFEKKVNAKTIYNVNSLQRSYEFEADGVINFNSSQSFQQKSYENEVLPDSASSNYHDNHFTFANDSQIDLNFLTKNSQNHKLAINSSWQFNYDSKDRHQNPYLDRFYLSKEFEFGEFEFGNNKAANQKMKLDPAQIARSAGGIRGKYLEYINLPMLANSNNSINSVCINNINDPACSNVKIPSFILLSQSPIGHGGYAMGINSLRVSNNLSSSSSYYDSFSKNHLRTINDDSFDGIEDATKINYYSPRIAGIKFGVSYIFNTNQNGFTNDVKNFYYPQFENVFAAAVNYIKYFDNAIKLSLSATVENGKSSNSNQEDLRAYDFATTVSYFGFKLSASYGQWQKYGASKNGIYSCQYNPNLQLNLQNCSNSVQKYNDPYYFSLGLSYRFGPFATSITSLNSKFEENKFQALSFGIDYKLNKSLMPYIEMTKFNFKSNQPMASDISNQYSISSDSRQIRDNNGYVLLTGIYYSF